jgi:copper chaperone
MTTNTTPSTQHSIQLNVQGMTCGHCERAVVQAIGHIDPRAQVQVNREQQKVTVTNYTTPLSNIISAITEEGYTVTPPTNNA